MPGRDGTGLAVANTTAARTATIWTTPATIDENAPEEAQDNNAVDRAQDECNGDHHRGLTVETTPATMAARSTIGPTPK